MLRNAYAVNYANIISYIIPSKEAIVLYLTKLLVIACAKNNKYGRKMWAVLKCGLS